MNLRWTRTSTVSDFNKERPDKGKFRFIAVLAFVFLSGLSLHALTLDQIRTEVRIRIKDSNTSRQRYTDTQLTNLINESQRDAINFSALIHKQTSITLVVGTTYYTLPTDVMMIERVTFKNKNLPEQTLTALDSAANYGAWEQTSGTASNYFQDPTQSTKLGIYPFPATAASTGTVKVMYQSQGTDLSSASDVPFNSETRFYPYHDLLIYEPCYKIFLIEGEYQKATEYRGYYELRLKQMIDYLGSRLNYKPGFSGPSPR